MKALSKFLAAFCFLHLAVCFNFVKFHVPKSAKENDTVQFDCDFNLQHDETFISVKWYKDGEQLYIRAPDESPEVKIWNLNGTHINLQKSTMYALVLDRVNEQSSGTYECEVVTGNTFNRKYRGHSRRNDMIVEGGDNTYLPRIYVNTGRKTAENVSTFVIYAFVALIIKSALIQFH